MTEAAEGTVVRPALGGLVEALDRVISSGAVVSGDLLISVADIELIRVDLRLLVMGVQGRQPGGGS
jgi:gas vesicle protein GvpA/GvpJ/GvpM family